jgi:Tol biopolymer transport system component
LLAFNTRPIFEGPGPDSSQDLWLVDVESGERRQVLAPGEGGGAFTFSPDGQQIALSNADSISLINRDGSNRRDGVLTFPAVLTYSEWTYYPSVRWSADSSALRVVIPPEAALERPDEPAVIWSVPADGSAPQQLISIVPRPLSFPQLSPDGARVAYVSPTGPPETNRSDLFIARVDGSDQTRYLTGDLLDFTVWAPDSQQFIFSMGQPFRSYVGQVGETPQPVSDTPSAYNIQWIDSSRFMFVTRTAQAVELRLGSAGAQSLLVHRADDPMSLLDFSLGQ